MNKDFLIVGIIAVGLSVSVCIYAQEIDRVDPASWITEIEYPRESEVSKYDVTSGVYYKLVDYQTNFEFQSTYFHFVQNILTSGGVSNASQVQLIYDSAFQQISLNKLIIWRNGKPIDKTNDVVFEFIKNEQELQSNIYSGKITALAVLEDLRKNDILETAYTITGINPVYDGAQYQLFPLEDINPVDRLHVRTIYSTNHNFSFNCHGCSDGELVKKSDSGLTELIVDRENLLGIEIEETTPPWIIPYDMLEVSSSSSWEEVIEWALRIFHQNDDNDIEKVFEEIFYPEYSNEEKINAIIDFVQDEIRYMGIESGIGNIKPFSPNQTISQRFGDCKDKSLLLVTMLKKIGVEKSYPALVNTTMLQNVSKLLPSEYVFDHCIVSLNYEGIDYWIDPSYSNQGGTFKDIVTFNYESALIIKEDTKGFTQLDIEDSVSETSIYEELDISSYEEPAKLKVKTELKGNKADYFRQLLEYYSRKDISDLFKYPYGILFPSIQESQKLKIKEIESANTFKTEEHYIIPDVWSEDLEGFKGKRTVVYEPANLYSYVNLINCEPKEFPVYYEYPIRYKQRSVIKLPAELSLESEDKYYDNAAFSFKRTAKMLDVKTAEIVFEFESKTKEIQPSEYADFCNQMNEIAKSSNIVFAFPKFDFNTIINNLTLQVSSNEQAKDRTANKNDSIILTLPAENNDSKQNNAVVVADVQPSYPGGMPALYKHVAKNMKYPKEAREAGVSGKVFVSFIVGETGEVNLIEVIKGIGSGCDEEAVKLIKSLKKWEPGKKDGKNVKVRMILPITFQL